MPMKHYRTPERHAYMRAGAAVILLALAVGAMGAEQSCCDPDLEPIKDPSLKYREREDGRCEGFYEAEVAGSVALEIVGFTHGHLRFEYPEDTDIYLSCPRASDLRVHVRAVGIPLRTYYRMDAVLEAGSFLVWPLDDVVHPGGLSADDIGVLAWRTDPLELRNERVYLPVRAALDPESDGLTSPVILWVRPTDDVELLQWRWADEVEGTCLEMGKWQDLDPATCTAGRAVGIEIATGTEGRICVQVTARTCETGRWLRCRAVLEVGEH